MRVEFIASPPATRVVAYMEMVPRIGDSIHLEGQVYRVSNVVWFLERELTVRLVLDGGPR